MDTFTHALSGWFAAMLLGHPELAPFLIAGAVIPDTDILLRRPFERYPDLYIFSHGGFTHSVLGATAIASSLFWIALLASLSSAPFEWLAGVQPPVLLLAFLAGAWMHLALDALAFPGLPLLYPVTERKYTLGIFPGPSPVLMVFSLVFIASSLSLHALDSIVRVYLLAACSFVLFNALLKLHFLFRERGRSIPTYNPFLWLVIQDLGDMYRVKARHLLRGGKREWIFDKWKGITAQEADRFLRLPEVARHRYFSYISVAECEGEKLRFRDPLRDAGLIFYPPYHASSTLSFSGSNAAPCIDPSNPENTPSSGD